MRNPVPRVAAIHDMSGFGRTSLTVAIPILSCMGIQVCPIPTAVLSTHTVEFTDYTLCDLTGELGGILDHWERLGLHFDGVYSGFMASPDRWTPWPGASAPASRPAGSRWWTPYSGTTACSIPP